MVKQVLYLVLIMYVLTLVQARNHDEIACSKYHFEEKVLEKLVRLEHKMDVWDAKMDTQISEINKAEVGRSDKMRTIQETIKSELTDQKKKIDELLITFENQAGRLSQDLLDKQAGINKTVLELKTNQDIAINQLKGQLSTPTIIFNAQKVSDLNPAESSTLKYTEITTNIGSGYNKESGIFTTPHDGSYLFTIQVCTGTRKWVMLQIMAANQVIATVNIYEHEAYTCSTGTGVATLSASDNVWVKCVYSQSATPLKRDTNYWNSFSGILIHKNIN